VLLVVSILRLPVLSVVVNFTRPLLAVAPVASITVLLKPVTSKMALVLRIPAPGL
jgi:hypothetical protein